MLIKRRRGWELPESAATPEPIYHGRRRFLRSAAAGSVLVGAGGLLAACDEPAQADGSGLNEGPGALQMAQAASDDPSAQLYPVPRNEAFVLDREITEERLAITYNNFYEFGSSKNIWQRAQDLPIRPWTISLTGEVEQPQQLAIDDLLAKVDLEERLYRHRCVEAWAMAVPWAGFPMRQLVEIAKPLSSAKYVKMVTFMDPDVASGQRSSWYPWPYVEGLTIEEATNELAFMGTGLYGKPMPKQNGSPLRLVVPWKYGFKSIKSIVSFEFTRERPVSFWEEIQGNEYGFWANVNPEVPHPRWSQATEELLGVDERVPTLLYNGYGEWVADLYEGKDQTSRTLWM
ncbi:protein-methionine-sulfoxide reductase catalytic subunit MsrP [Algihabitans albus]|uniref:protein-methionine-sulfoxide reductase catalytic subunit MsrP n=1 Tax=Algihabitans albus TaxID=2164067 RepID=UPI0035CF5B35